MTNIRATTGLAIATVAMGGATGVVVVVSDVVGRDVVVVVAGATVVVSGSGVAMVTAVAVVVVPTSTTVAVDSTLESELHPATTRVSEQHAIRKQAFM